nr:XkdX family protein [uncultured Dysosmobacter sp.]
MFNRLKRLYCEGRLTDDALQTAVERGWITDEEKQEIVAAKKDERYNG